jgi:hypothetical protein
LLVSKLIDGSESKRGQQEESKAEIYTWAARLGRQEGEREFEEEAVRWSKGEICFSLYWNGWLRLLVSKLIDGSESKRGQQEESKAEIYTWAARLGRQEGEIFVKKIN